MDIEYDFSEDVWFEKSTGLEILPRLWKNGKPTISKFLVVRYKVNFISKRLNFSPNWFFKPNETTYLTATLPTPRLFICENTDMKIQKKFPKIITESGKSLETLH